MKKSLISLALLAVLGSAMAHNGPSPAPTPAPTVVATVSSEVNGATSSYSVANGVNQSSIHGSVAYATNTTCVDGATNVGQKTANGITTATSTGSTFTAAGGVGLGGSYAGASQYGNGTVTATVAKPSKTNGTTSSVTSNAVVGTESFAQNVNSGLAFSGSNAVAANVSAVTVSAQDGQCRGGTCTSATGITAGVDKTTTYGNVIGGNETVGAGGTLTVGDVKNVGSFQSGSFSGNVKVTNASI